jgi:hypothetical protein
VAARAAAFSIKPINGSHHVAVGSAKGHLKVRQLYDVPLSLLGVPLFGVPFAWHAFGLALG